MSSRPASRQRSSSLVGARAKHSGNRVRSGSRARLGRLWDDSTLREALLGLWADLAAVRKELLCSLSCELPVLATALGMDEAASAGALLVAQSVCQKQAAELLASLLENSGLLPEEAPLPDEPSAVYCDRRVAAVSSPVKSAQALADKADAKLTKLNGELAGLARVGKVGEAEKRSAAKLQAETDKSLSKLDAATAEADAALARIVAARTALGNIARPVVASQRGMLRALCEAEVQSIAEEQKSLSGVTQPGRHQAKAVTSLKAAMDRVSSDLLTLETQQRMTLSQEKQPEAVSSATLGLLSIRLREARRALAGVAKAMDVATNEEDAEEKTFQEAQPEEAANAFDCISDEDVSAWLHSAWERAAPTVVPAGTRPDPADAAASLMARLDAMSSEAGALEADVQGFPELCTEVQTTPLRTAALRLAAHSEALLEVLDAVAESRALGLSSLRDWKVAWLSEEACSDSTELEEELRALGRCLGGSSFAASKGTANRPDGLTRLTALHALGQLIARSQVRRRIFDGVVTQ